MVTVVLLMEFNFPLMVSSDALTDGDNEANPVEVTIAVGEFSCVIRLVSNSTNLSPRTVGWVPANLIALDCISIIGADTPKSFATNNICERLVMDTPEFAEIYTDFSESIVACPSELRLISFAENSEISSFFEFSTRRPELINI